VTSLSDRGPESNIRAFPSSRTVAVVVERWRDGGGWLVRAPNGNGWLLGNFDHAVREAREIADGFNVVVLSSAGVS
jgi:hypothetical protein